MNVRVKTETASRHEPELDLALSSSLTTLLLGAAPLNRVNGAPMIHLPLDL